MDHAAELSHDYEIILNNKMEESRSRATKPNSHIQFTIKIPPIPIYSTDTMGSGGEVVVLDQYSASGNP